ncbi:hypothetical protein PSHT_01676 [Puccinia striiformis]|uniref:DNA 3'-5' helicase n=1 Tax=Puccinia striiformis TaxID=27350 RepID=A0A2S4WK34_9BASI|nr:hypothetical protein PSHT_01676 [Puccinia striiformis]
MSKGLVIFTRHEDKAVFRPGYGCIATRLLATNKVPLLLLSATCRPIAVDAIINNLKLRPSDVTMLEGELTRPEIRIIRIPMKSTLSSCDDLLRIFAPENKLSADETVPTLIYSSTRNLTFQVMKVVNEARHTKMDEYDPLNPFIRRYHSVTGDEDKDENMDDFSHGNFPIFSATMALGLGQNLKQVRCVIHMGRGDPASIVQMIGRCGRDGQPGLALLFMEPVRQNGKNDVNEFDPNVPQGDDDRMDAFAVTNVCMRVSVAMDSINGYIPLSTEDPNYKAEAERERRMGFEKCQCSGCLPDEAKALINVIQQANKQNFTALVTNPSSIIKDDTIKILTRKTNPTGAKDSCKYPEEVAANLANHLVEQFEIFFVKTLGRSCHLASTFFGILRANAVVASIDQIRDVEPHNTDLLKKRMGGEYFSGQVDWINNSITEWLNSEYYRGVVADAEAYDVFIAEETMRLRTGHEEQIMEGLEELAAQGAEKKFQAGIIREQKKELAADEKKRLAAEKNRLAVENQAAKKLARDIVAAQEAAEKVAKQAARNLAREAERLAKANKISEEKRIRKDNAAALKQRAQGKKAESAMRAQKKLGKRESDAQALEEIKEKYRSNVN